MTGAERRLVLLRHAKSAWPEGKADAERPLAGRGRRDAPAAGRWLRDHVADIDLVVCSPAVRARQTWDLVSAELDALLRVRYDERLYGACAEDLLAVTRELPQRAPTVLLVGHNPGLEDLVELLTGAVRPLRTSAVVVLTCPGNWADAGPRSSALEEFATPRGR